MKRAVEVEALDVLERCRLKRVEGRLDVRQLVAGGVPGGQLGRLALDGLARLP